MLSVFFAIPAIFVERKFFRGIHLIAHGNVVLTFADRADERKQCSLILFGHRRILYRIFASKPRESLGFYRWAFSLKNDEKKQEDNDTDKCGRGL